MVAGLLAGRWLLALVLLAAGVVKLSAAGRMASREAIRNYRVLPDGLVGIGAAVLPWIELAIGGCLATGVLVAPFAVCAAFLFGGFAGLVGWHVSRGRVFACGCGTGSQISWRLAGRDLLLCMLATTVAVDRTYGLALWPGSGSAAGSARALLPVPLLVILSLVAAKLLPAFVRLSSRRDLDESIGIGT